MRFLTRLLLFSSIAVGWVTSEQLKDTSDSLLTTANANANALDTQTLSETETETESELHINHPPQHVDPWAKRYLTALTSAGDLSSYIIDDSTTDFVFPARFKKAHETKNLCHGALRVESRPDVGTPTSSTFSPPKPTIFPRSFYGWDQEYCEWLTAVSYAKMKPEERKSYVKDPTIFFYRVPEESDDNLFLYTESRETFQMTLAKNLQRLPPRRKAAWNAISKKWNQKPQAVKLVNDVCEMMGKQSLWPKKFIGTINRVPFSSGLLIAMGEMGAQLELEDDTDPTLTTTNRLQKIAQFYQRYANAEAQAKMQPWLWAMGNGTRADDWVSNYQLEVTLCSAPDNSVGSTKLKSYQIAGDNLQQIYPPTCANIWNKKHETIKDEPVILDYGAAMQIGPYCGKSGKEWCRPALFGITTAQFPAVMTRIRQDNMRRLFSLKRRGRGPITAEYNALIDRLIQLIVQPDWFTDDMVQETRTISKALLDILDPKPTTVPPTTKPPTQPPMCCCCMGCQTCCGNPIAKLKQKVVQEAEAQQQYDVDSGVAQEENDYVL